MAYAVKYRLKFKDNEDVQWQADIYQDGYVGTVTDVIGTGDPVHIKLAQFDDLFEPICSSNATINILSESAGQFSEFMDADIYEYYIRILRGGSVHWQGVYITEPFTESFEAPPYPIQLIFNDGLAELQYERYDDSGTLRAGFETAITILTKCFSFLPFTRNTMELVNILDDSMNDADTEGLLEQLVIFESAFWEKDKSDDVIKGENCLEVIRGIMSSLKCRIIVSQNKWYIIRIGEMMDVSIKFVEYDITGAATSNNTIDLRRAINKTAAMDTLLRHLAGGNNTISKEYQEIEFLYSSKNIMTLDNNLILDWNFNKGYELQNNSPVPQYWTRSSAVNGVINTNPTSMHIRPSEQGDPLSGDKADVALVFENDLLSLTKITSYPTINAGVLIPNDAAATTRETYHLIAESPINPSITFKNLLHDTGDYIEIRIRGYFDYTFLNGNYNAYPCMMFNKWKIQLGSNYYHMETGGNVWNTNASNRVWDMEFNTYASDSWVVPGQTKRHNFDKTITLENFPTSVISDLIITWYIPENYRKPFSYPDYLQERISSMKIVVNQMEAHYVSNDSTEFSIQKVLGETGSTSLRRKRYKANIKHGDGPSNFSVMSFRKPTNNMTTTWSSRGGAEGKPGYKILVIEPIFENLATLRQVFSGQLYGFMEMHNTVTGIDSKTYAIKGFDHNLKHTSYDLKLHEIGPLAPTIIYIDQFTLSGGTKEVENDSTYPDIAYPTNDGDSTTFTQMSITNTQQLTSDNNPGSGNNFPQ